MPECHLNRELNQLNGLGLAGFDCCVLRRRRLKKNAVAKCGCSPGSEWYAERSYCQRGGQVLRNELWPWQEPKQVSPWPG